MMSSLYELTGEYLELQRQLEMGEEVDLEAINDELENKADNYARIIRNIESDNTAIDSEIKRLQERKRTNKNSIDTLKNNLEMCMRATGKKKFKTDLFSFSIAKNGGKLPFKVTVDTDELPYQFCNTVITPNIEAIREYVHETGDVQYGYEEERGESLRIR